MATFTNLDQEKLAEADKHEQRKANTFGFDKPAIEEPFGSSEIVLREDIFSETPTADTNFVSPDYGEWPSGAVASRREKIRLHPLITSGITGLSSIQTFVAVSSVPASDNPVDIEAVRIKHIVPPDLSFGRANAAHADANFRGFELALFPACSVVDATSPTGSSLDAYDGYGSIPITVDPTVAYGMGGDARWTIDYANGIVRFTGAPLNGATGLMNPFSVYGDINGYERPTGTGRITMFATFYQYTGPSLTDSDDVRMVTVGDGTNSFGTYYGATSTIMQLAVDSLSPYGGVVYLKEGDYTYTSNVDVPENVSIIGLSKRVEITRPDDLPAFIIQGSDSAVKGVTVKTTGTTSKRADIEISTSSASQTIENVSIEDNELWATHDAYGVGFAPKHLNATYKNINIDGNMFDSPSFERPVYVGNYIIEDLSTAPSVSLENINISHNDFRIPETSIDGYAVLFEGGTSESGIIEDIRELHIVDNNMALTADIGIDVDIILENIRIENNSEFRNIYVNGLSSSTIRNNIFNDAHLDGYITDSQFKDNIISSFNINDTVSDFGFAGNTCFGLVRFHADNASAEWEINGVNITGNKFHDSLNISDSLSGVGQHDIKNLSITNNIITGSLSFADSAASTGSILYTDLNVTGNIIGDKDTTIVDSIIFGKGSVSNIYLDASTFSGNIMHGNAVFYNRVYSDTDSTGVKFADNMFDSTKGIYLHSRILNNVIALDNSLAYIDLFSDPYDSADGGSVSGVVVKNNMLIGSGTITLHDMTAASSGFTLQGCTVEDNIFSTTGTISIMESTADTNDYTFEDMSVSGNKLVAGSINIGGTLDSDSNLNDLSVRNNWVYGGSLSVAAATGSRANVSGNTVSVDLVLGGDLTNAMVSGNMILGAIDINGDLDETTVVSNKAGSSGIDFAGTIGNSIISANTSGGKLELHGACDESKINDNRIEGDLTVVAMTNSTVDSNSILGSSGVSSTTWSACTFANNEIEANINVSTSITNSVFDGGTVRGNVTSLGAVTKSVITGFMVTGTFVATAVASSRISENTIGTTSETGDVVTITSLTDSSFTNNTVLRDEVNTGTGGINISGAVTYSHIDGNSCDGDLIISGTLGNYSTVANNNARVFSLSTVSYTSVTGNVVDSGTMTAASAVALTMGNLTNVMCSNNMFKSTLAAADIVIGDCTDVIFSGNLVFAESVQKVNFGALIRTEITDCNFDGGSVEITSMVSSTIDNSVLSGGLTMPTLAGTLMDKSFITNSEITGAVSFTNSGTSAMFLNSTISGNMLTNTSTNSFIIRSGDKIFEQSHFNNNTVLGVSVMDVNEDSSGHYWLLESTFCDNIFVGGLGCLGVNSATYATYSLDSIISGNQFDGYLTIGEDIHTSTSGSMFDNTVFDSNMVGGVFTLGKNGRTAVSYNNSTLNNNSFNSNVIIYGALAGCSTNGNTVIGNVNLGTFNGTVFSGNIIGSDGTGSLTLGGITQNSICSSNVINGAFEVDDAVYSGTVSSSNIIGNTINTTFIIDGAITDSVINENNIVGASTITGTFSDSSFSSNHSAATITFAAALDSCVVNANVLDDSSDLIFSGAVGGSNTTGCLISSNKCDNLTLSGNCDYNNIVSNFVNGTFALSEATTKQFVNITGNRFHIVSITNGGLLDVVFNNNIITLTTSIVSLINSTVSGNMFNDLITITGSTSLCSVEGNVMYGDDSSVSMDIQGSFNNSVFSNNVASNSFKFSRTSGDVMTGTTISSNIAYGALIILDRIYESIISDNVIYGSSLDSSFEAISDCSITGNKFTDDVNITAAISNTTISGNNFNGSGTALDIQSIATSTVFNGNYIDDVDFNGTLTDCAVTDNVFSSTADFSVMNDCIISGNQFDGAMTSGILTRCTMLGNNSSVSVVLNKLNQVSLTTNVFAGTFGSSEWADVTFGSNVFDGAVSMGSDGITESSLGNNIFNSTVVSGKWLDVSCNGNTFNGTVTVTDTGTSTTCIDRVTFQGNVCKALVHFAKSGNGSSDNFLHSTFNGNVFHVGLVFGSSGITNEHTRTAITGNSGAGYITFYVGDGGTEIDSCMVVGNTMTGALTIDSTDASTYPIPPTSGTGHVMVALNWFGSYSGIVFTNHSIGWGDTVAADTGTTDGSNKISSAA